MDGGETHLCAPDKEENDEDDAPDCLSRVRLVDAPILLFVCYHRALRGELNELRRLAETSSLQNVSHSRELILKLHRRFEFFKLALKYHCVAEDEVIFPALDVHVKNVVCTYSLEHNCTEDLFTSIFHYLDELMNPNENLSEMFQELIYCMGILKTTMFQHMLKEEEQVFPLLMQKFSTKEQALLVWQFICSVPIMLLQQVLPWMASFLSADKQAELRQCLNEIAPMEKELQEVLISWLGSNVQTFTEVWFLSKEVQCADPLNMETSLGMNSSNRNFRTISNQKKENFFDVEDRSNKVNVLHLWHDAIKKDMKEILEELYEIRSSACFQNLDSLLIQIKFFADVLIFYRNAQKKFFPSVLSELGYGWLTKCTEQFLSESHIEDLQRLLFYNAESGMPLCKFVEELYRELKLFMTGLNNQFAFQETEVFTVIQMNCGNGMLEMLMSFILHMMPLGLLKCVITWFSVHLSEIESRSILSCMKQGNPFVHGSVALLLQEWFRVGYSGKTSTEKFRQDLWHIFKSKSSLLTEQVKKAPGFSFLNYDKPHKGSIISGKNCLSYSSSGFNNVVKYETPYSTRINLHIFFPATAMKLNHCPRFQATNSSSISFLDDPKPIDLIFFVHKAIKKDLDYLVHGSAELEKNVDLLVDFRKRFNLISFLHQIHRETEDEIAFPALEAMTEAKNISLSHTIDHELEVQHFNKISCILDKMSDLHLSVSSFKTNTWEKRMLKHNQLCRKLREICKSMHKILSDHVNREEIEIWHLIRDFSNSEQIKIVGCMLGRISAEILQDMIPWLMASLTPEEQHVSMFLWSMVTKNTMFDEWLAEWWEGYSIAKETERSNDPPVQTVEPLEIISKYLSEEVLDELREESSSNKSILLSQDHSCDSKDLSHNCNLDGKAKVLKAKQNSSECLEGGNQMSDNSKQAFTKVTEITCSINDIGQSFQFSVNSGFYDRLMKISQDDLEIAIRKVSRDSSLDLQKKSYIIQNLLMSRWIVRQQISCSEVAVTSNGQEFPGQLPSYRDPLKQIYGCKHYKRNCKLFAACCNQLHTCIHCHNEEVSDHSIDRKSITKMMCMKCLMIQPISAMCSTASCRNFSMAKYYCRICRLFDDEREIYHCPYCNLCRVGKGLGVDYFHCMNCNACMSRSLTVHICREKSLEDNCPICHEYIFTSCAPVKALPCGHAMHSICFQEYTYFNYTCPICYKSLGDMQNALQVYFRMLDALLAEEKIPDEHLGQTQLQVILCNDCEKKGAAPFHWLYHKCPSCGSYNTRVL
ncbi:zinc finger protein BRUTUS-like [Senna tora]|uniref:Zinc finger protein BRUTUS-like n=1 Tax=Senna tora TaxID=362788 RepID=A0A834W209_9FABA|nr:zinc finger protein BRUTUS-like [Senna tora]